MLLQAHCNILRFYIVCTDTESRVNMIIALCRLLSLLFATSIVTAIATSIVLHCGQVNETKLLGVMAIVRGE